MKKIYKYYSPCIDCGKPCDKRSIRCKECNNKFKSETYRGASACNYKHGGYTKQYFCKDCGIEISADNGINGQAHCPSCSQKGKLNGNYKHGETLKKHYCVDCNEEIDYRNKRCKKCANSGKNHPCYIENLIREYPIAWTKILKESIRIRDEYTCQICGKIHTLNDKKPDVHHIDYAKNNLDPLNLITLCHSCHMETNANREIYIEFFSILKQTI